jgi:steroid Delta-isomerase
VKGLAVGAFTEHCRRWNAGDRQGWLALFADDVTMDDPVGVPTKRGRAHLEITWDRSHQPGRSWRLEPRRMVECADEVAVDLVNAGMVDGVPVEVESIEIWRVDATGRVTAVRSYFEPDSTVNDPWYVPVE